MDAPTWWHYTLGTVLFDIIATGSVERPRTGMTPTDRRAVWFSCRPTWEPSATRASISGGGRRLATIPEMVDRGGGLVRIRVSDEIARHPWAAHRKLSGLDARTADALELAARSRGANPDDWRASYHDVPLREILSVDVSLDGETWTPAGGTYIGEDGGGLDLDADLIHRIRTALGVEP
ncbi:MAG: hypothetical protein AB7N65_06395 [Vicinamibacterales bacterium]